MADINLDYLLEDIAPDAPCGENLEEEPEFLQLEEAARFVEERQMGDLIIPAEEPDWKLVRQLALELLKRSHDVQVIMYLTCALLRLEGFDGFEQSLKVLKAWLQDYWDDVYPLQDPEDDYPILRINILTTLNDYQLILGPINRLPLTQSALGNFSWRDIEKAEGKISVDEDEEAPDRGIIDAAFDDTDFVQLKAIEVSLNNSLSLLQAITATVSEKAGSAYSPDFSLLTKLLLSIKNFLSEKLELRAENESTEESSTDEESVSGDSSIASQKTNKAGIHNRSDVIKAIDEICQYFERYEPSSPVPFLLQRSKKLLSMSFIEILRDLTPDAVQQAENICGIHHDEE